MSYRLICVSTLMIVLAGCASTRANRLFRQGLDAQRQGKNAVARELYERVLRHEPSAVGAMNNLAVAYLDDGYPERAMALLQESLQIDGDNLLTHFLFTASMLQAGAWRRVSAEVSRTLALRERLIAATVTRLGLPSYEGLNLWVAGDDFVETLKSFARSAQLQRALSPREQRRVVRMTLCATPNGRERASRARRHGPQRATARGGGSFENTVLASRNL